MPAWHTPAGRCGPAEPGAWLRQRAELWGGGGPAFRAVLTWKAGTAGAPRAGALLSCHAAREAAAAAVDTRRPRPASPRRPLRLPGLSRSCPPASAPVPPICAILTPFARWPAGRTGPPKSKEGAGGLDRPSLFRARMWLEASRGSSPASEQGLIGNLGRAPGDVGTCRRSVSLPQRERGPRTHLARRAPEPRPVLPGGGRWWERGAPDRPAAHVPRWPRHPGGGGTGPSRACQHCPADRAGDGSEWAAGCGLPHPCPALVALPEGASSRGDGLRRHEFGSYGTCLRRAGIRHNQK